MDRNTPDSPQTATPVASRKRPREVGPARGAALRALFARLSADRAGDWLESELRTDLKHKGARSGDGFPNLVRRASVIEVPGGRARAGGPDPEADRPSLVDVLCVAAARLAVRLPVSREAIGRELLSGAFEGSMPVGEGVALPHGRLAGLRDPHLLLARCPGGARLPVRRGRNRTADAVQALLVLVGPAEQPRRHLRLLAELAARADNPRFLTLFLSARGERELRQALLGTARRPPAGPRRRPRRRDRGSGPGAGRSRGGGA